MEMSWASRRVGRKGERRVEESGGRMVLPGMLEVRGTEPLIAGSGLRRVDMVEVEVRESRAPRLGGLLIRDREMKIQRGLAIVDCTSRARKCVVLDGGDQRKGWRLHWINNDVMVMLKMLVSHMWLVELTESGTLSRHRFLPSSIVNCRQVLVYRDRYAEL
jgi:hypothetical protein